MSWQQLLFTHLVSAAVGAALLWALRRLLVRRRWLRIERRTLRQVENHARQERALREELNLATESAGIGIWHYDLRTRQITTDAHTRALLGIDREVEDPFASVVADDRERIKGVVYAALSDAAQ